MLIKSDSVAEKNQIEKLISEDPELYRQHAIFVEEMNFKQELINTRKNLKLTQKDMSEKSGLSQQSISRLEKGNGGTIETVLKYLNAMGMTLSIKNI